MMKVLMLPMLHMPVQYKTALNLPKVVEGLKQLSNLDPIVLSMIEESPEYKRVKYNMDVHEDFMVGWEILGSDPIV